MSDKSHNSCQTPHEKMRKVTARCCVGDKGRHHDDVCHSVLAVAERDKLLFFPSILQLQPRKEEMCFLDDGPLLHCSRLKSRIVLSFPAVVQRVDVAGHIFITF